MQCEVRCRPCVLAQPSTPKFFWEGPVRAKGSGHTFGRATWQDFVLILENLYSAKYFQFPAVIGNWLALSKFNFIQDTGQNAQFTEGRDTICDLRQTGTEYPKSTHKKFTVWFMGQPKKFVPNLWVMPNKLMGNSTKFQKICPRIHG